MDTEKSLNSEYIIKTVDEPTNSVRIEANSTSKNVNELIDSF